MSVCDLAPAVCARVLVSNHDTSGPGICSTASRSPLARGTRVPRVEVSILFGPPVIDAGPHEDRVSHIHFSAALLRPRHVRRTGRHRPRRLKHFLRCLPVAGLIFGLSADSGFGGDTRVGIEITSDRDPDDFAIPSAMKYKFRVSHSLDSGISLGASLEITDTAFSSSHSENLEATAGYRYRFTDAFSLVGSVGAGERFRAASDGGNFPYYRSRRGEVRRLRRCGRRKAWLRYRGSGFW